MPSTTHDAFYPLAVGNTWTYSLKNGDTFTNSVTAIDPSAEQQYIMVNSMQKKDQHVRKDGAKYFVDTFEDGNFQLLLKDNATVGESWEVLFKANGFDNVLVMTVKEVGSILEVDGKAYTDVTLIEAESKMKMNGNLMPLNFFTQYYYAKGVGLVLTTSSAGDRMALTSSTLV